MFENVINFFKKIGKKDQIEAISKDTAKERLHLVLMQDRANVSADFLDMMRQEIIEVIKKYIDVDEKDIDVRLTNKTNEDGTTGAPALYANIPIAGIREEMKEDKTEEDKNSKKAVEEKASDENNEKVVKDDSKDEELDESTVDTSDDDESVDDESEKSDVENEDNKSENDDSEDDNEEVDETDDSKDSEEVKEKVSANKSNEE